MKKPSLSYELCPATDEEIKTIAQGIDLFNQAQVNFKGTLWQEHLNYVFKDQGKVVAGITTYLYFGQVLYVHILFVEEDYRHHGLGSMLLQKVEKIAQEKGAHLVHLDTFDFQAKDFYLKYGYEVFGVLEDCPKGHKRYYLKKVLQV